MHAVAGTLVKRGLEIHQNGEYQLPAWGIAILVLTGFAFFAMDASIEYTFGRLIPTLIMVETPQADVITSTSDGDAPLVNDGKYSDDVKPPLSPSTPSESELLLIHRPLITRTFCSTLRHLRTISGRFARHRALLPFIAYTVSLRTITHTLIAFPYFPSLLAPVIAAILIANLAMTWTHVAISMPSTKRWYQRIPTVSQWKKVAGPSAALAVAKEACCMVPMSIASRWGLFAINSSEELRNLPNSETHVLAWKAGAVGLLALMMIIVLVIPANVTLTRIQASLLAEEHDTVVPFDRTFGGKVIPEIVGGTGVVEAREAWKSFDMGARARLFKAYGKVILFEVVWAVVFGAALVGELVLIMGDDIKKFIPREGESWGV